MTNRPAGWLSRLADRLAADDAPVEGEGLPDALDVVLLGGRRRYTRVEIAEAAGLDDGEGLRLWRALGFAEVPEDEIAFTDLDLEAARIIARLGEEGVLPAEVREAVTRSIAQAMSGLAQWQVGMLARLVEATPEAERPETTLRLASTALPAIERLQSYVWHRHLAATVHRLIAMQALPDAAAERAWLAVGFADMVGYTRTTRSRSIDELGEVLERFFSSAAEVVAEGRGRIVKTIGDEVMFVADRAVDAAAIALDLQDRISPESGLPALRVGLTAGPVLVRFGDVYGEVVNIAARLTSRARPGRVLVDSEVAAAVAEDPAFSVRSLRPMKVRGYDHLARWRLARGQ